MSEYDFDVYEAIITRDNDGIAVRFPQERPSLDGLDIPNPCRVKALLYGPRYVRVIIEMGCSDVYKQYKIKAKRVVMKEVEE